MKPKRRTLQSLSRASDILDFFLNEDRSLGLTDIVKRTGLPKSTVQGLIYSLESLDYLEQDSDTYKYRLGPKLFQLGMKYLTSNDIFETTQVWMERLSYKFHEAVNAGMLIDNKVVVVMRIEPDKRFMTYPKVGAIIPIHSSSIGKTLLAHLPGDKQLEILKDHQFTKYTENSIDNLDDFLEELKTVKDEGISYDREESAMGLSCIGAGIFNKKGQVIFAFTLSGQTEVINENREEIINTVRETSSQLSKQLGFIGAVY